MDRWQGKVAVVTGASRGIGATIAKDLAKAGLITIGLARNPEEIEKNRLELPTTAQSRFHAKYCDIGKEEDIVSVFKEIVQEFGGVDVLVNNAGIAVWGVGLLNEDNSRTLIDTVNINLLGLAFCTREAVRSITDRKTFGHVIHINSTSGHTKHIYYGPDAYPLLNIYGPTKYAVTAFTEEQRQEMNVKGIRDIKVSSISPGVVKTPIYNNDDYLDNTPHLLTEDVSNAVLYVLSTPPHVQVHELIIRPLGEKV